MTELIADLTFLTGMVFDYSLDKVSSSYVLDLQANLFQIRSFITGGKKEVGLGECSSIDDIPIH